MGKPETILLHPAESLSEGIPPAAGTGRQLLLVSSASAQGQRLFSALHRKG